jgi:hypothetical protein
MNSRRFIFTLSLKAERSYKPTLATGRAGCSQIKDGGGRSRLSALAVLFTQHAQPVCIV